MTITELEGIIYDVGLYEICGDLNEALLEIEYNMECTIHLTYSEFRDLESRVEFTPMSKFRIKQRFRN